MATPPHLYAIGLGSNRRHGRHGAPDSVLKAALLALADHGTVIARSPTLASAPLGPSLRRFANAAALFGSPLDPPELLAALKEIERRFGRRRGRRWGERVLDLDILLWAGGAWRERSLAVPHRALTQRRFVLDPLLAIAPDWRLPGTALTIRHLSARLTRRAPLHRDAFGRVRSSVGRASDF